MRSLQTSLLALLAASVTGVVAVVDFSFYPLTAQDCMYKASNASKCDSASVSQTNKCLCSNGGNFITGTAECLGTSAPGDVVPTVYKTMKQACLDSKTPISITEQQFLSAASAPKSKTTSSSSSTSTSQTTTATDTSKPTETKQGGSDEQKKGLSTGAMAGIIAGGSIVGIAVITGIVVLLLRRRRRKDEEESHPMLAHNHNPLGHGHNPSGQNFYPTPGQAVVVGHNVGRDSGAGSWSNETKWGPGSSPDPRNTVSTFNWETPYDPAGSPPIKQGFHTPPLQQGFPSPPPLHQGFPTPPPPLQQGFAAQPYKPYQPPLPSPQPQIFELGSSQLPAEAPGSTISSSTAAEMEGTPAPHGYPSQFGGGARR